MKVTKIHVTGSINKKRSERSKTLQAEKKTHCSSSSIFLEDEQKSSFLGIRRSFRVRSFFCNHVSAGYQFHEETPERI